VVCSESLRGGFQVVSLQDSFLDQLVSFMGGICFDVDEDALFFVVLEKRLGLVVIDAETVLDARHRVILSLRQGFSSDIVDSWLFRWAVCCVVHSSTWHVRPSVCSNRN